MKEQIKRLEQALSYWETLCMAGSLNWRLFGISVHEPTSGLGGDERNWKQFRGYLMGLKPMEQFAYDDERFSMSMERRLYLPGSSRIPEFLAYWTAESRRVFALSRELQALLSSMSLGDYSLNDIQFPFGTFVLTLEQPFVDDQQSLFDCVIVRRSGLNVQIMILSPELDQFRVISKFTYERLEGLLKKGKANALREEILKLNEQKTPPTSWLGMLAESLDEPVAKAMVRTFRGKKMYSVLNNKVGPREVSGLHAETLFQIVFGFCLYLSSLPPQSAHRSTWKKVLNKQERKANPRGIINEAEVCSISSTIYLTTEQIELIESQETQAKREICPHFRRGHFRRPPGQGQNPEAPRTVAVAPTFVKRGLHEEGTLAAGAKTVFH